MFKNQKLNQAEYLLKSIDKIEDYYKILKICKNDAAVYQKGKIEGFPEEVLTALISLYYEEFPKQSDF